MGEIKATIARKTIRAPFSGILGLRQVNLGQYLPAGEAIVSLQALNPIYVNFGVPQQTAPQVQVGHSLRVSSNDVGGAKFSGRGYGPRLDRERGHPQRSGAGNTRKSRRQAASRHVR